MADSIAAMDVLHTIFCNEFVSDMKMACVIYLTGRNQMVVDQHCFVRIPNFLKSHFFKFFSDKRNENIVDHHTIYLNGDDVIGFRI